MIYLNQAATAYPKPKTVLEAAERAMALPPSSQFRAFSEAAAKEDVFVSCKKELAELFGIRNSKIERGSTVYKKEDEGCATDKMYGCSSAGRIVFTSGATDSMNRIVRGLRLDGCSVAVTQAEHNAALRCVYNIPKQCDVIVIGCDEAGRLRLPELEEKITDQTKALFVNHCSNVTGAVNDLKEIARIVHGKGCLLAADVSQSAGIFPIDVEEMGIDILCFTAHKGLYGLQGTGGYYVRAGVPFVQTYFGGTGTRSAEIRFSEEEALNLPEAGTQNEVGIAGLLAGVRFVKDVGIDVIHKKEQKLLQKLTDGMQRLAAQYPKAGITIYSAGEAPLLSFTMRHLPPQDIGYLLAHGYGITVRTGLHCAPLIHKALGTLPNGTVRVSLSYFNTEADIEAFLHAAEEIAAIA